MLHHSCFHQLLTTPQVLIIKSLFCSLPLPWHGSTAFSRWLSFGLEKRWCYWSQNRTQMLHWNRRKHSRASHEVTCHILCMGVCLLDSVCLLNTRNKTVATNTTISSHFWFIERSSCLHLFLAIVASNGQSSHHVTKHNLFLTYTVCTWYCCYYNNLNSNVDTLLSYADATRCQGIRVGQTR